MNEKKLDQINTTSGGKQVQFPRTKYQYCWAGPWVGSRLNLFLIVILCLEYLSSGENLPETPPSVLIQPGSLQRTSTPGRGSLSRRGSICFPPRGLPSSTDILFSEIALVSHQKSY